LVWGHLDLTLIITSKKVRKVKNKSWDDLSAWFQKKENKKNGKKMKRNIVN
jgi:hypothetical protein